jgi:hypothetical protein
MYFVEILTFIILILRSSVLLLLRCCCDCCGIKHSLLCDLWRLQVSLYTGCSEDGERKRRYVAVRTRKERDIAFSAGSYGTAAEIAWEKPLIRLRGVKVMYSKAQAQD